MSNSVTSFAGFLKTKYASRVVNTIPEGFGLQRAAGFSRATKIGKGFSQAVITKLEHGATYKGAGGGNFTLDSEVDGAISEATVDGAQMVLKSGIDYETLSKATAKGDVAYGSAADRLYQQMVLSARKRLEIEMWYGQSSEGLGIVDSTTASTIVLEARQWSPGMWVAMEGAKIEVFTSALTTQRTGTATISGVDVDNLTLTIDTLPTGTVATDRVFLKTNRTTSAWNSMLGLVPMGKKTSGTVFNIDVANSIWAPVQYDFGANEASFQRAQQMCEKSVVKGAEGTSCLWVPTEAWTDLLTEQANLRRYGGSHDGRIRMMKNGARGIEFFSASGTIEIKPTLYLMLGNAVLHPKNCLSRVGATDVTFQIPGMERPNVHVSDGSAGVTLRAYYNQALFSNKLGQIVVGSDLATSLHA